MDQEKMTALCRMDASLQTLFRLYCREHPSEQEIGEWFSGIDFEALRPEASCMAAMLSAAANYAGVPQEVSPRLRGITKYVHTLNTGMIAGLCALEKRYNEAGICALVHKRAAIHLGYPDHPLQHIWQTEISVSREEYAKAAALAEAEGYAVTKTELCTIARKGHTQCVAIYKRAEDGDLLRSASLQTAGGASFLLPGSESLLVHYAETVFHLMAHTGAGAGLLPWLADLRCVLQADPDLSAAAAIAEARGTASQVRLVLALYGQLAPGAVTQQTLDSFATEAKADALADAALAYIRIPPKKRRIQRIWLTAKMRSADAPERTWAAFTGTLLQKAVRKLTPGN